MKRGHDLSDIVGDHYVRLLQLNGNYVWLEKFGHFFTKSII